MDEQKSNQPLDTKEQRACPFQVNLGGTLNWLVLKGTLGADKARLLAQIRSAIAAPEAAHLRPAWARGL